MAEWFSLENLESAWNYVRLDIKDDFVFDVIDYEDVKFNIAKVLQSLHDQLKHDQYTPAPIVRIGVPKNFHSVRPGTVVPIVDLIVLYAIIQQLAPALDVFLCDSAYAYRLNPKSNKPREPLFKDKSQIQSEAEKEPEQVNVEIQGDDEVEIDFPSGWFVNWKAFHDASKLASKAYEHVAVTDITAFFENIYLDLLREILKSKLTSDEHILLVDKLFHLLEYWDWNRPGNLPKGRGLPQGNDVSAFVSNLYLISLDDSMMKIVSGDNSKYARYVDDVKLFTSNKDEARKALIRLEEVLRSLNLNVQSAKTEIKPAADVIDDDVEVWLDRMSDENPNKAGYAVEFFESYFDAEKLDRWQRPYARCLSVLGQVADDRAVNTALNLFTQNPSYRLLNKNFTYLRRFVSTRFYSDEIVKRLTQDEFIFPYHKGYLFRLSSYCRDNSDSPKQLALQESLDINAHWFSRMAALSCLSTYPLDGKELDQIAGILDREASYQVNRAAFVTLCQYWGDSLKGVLDRVSLFNAPHQDYLRRYFFRLYRDEKIGIQVLSKIKREKIEKPFFIHKLHQLDLLKANSETEHRKIFLETIQEKIRESNNWDTPRLTLRLERIYDLFVLRPQ